MSKVKLVFVKDHGLHFKKGDPIEVHEVQADYFISNGIAQKEGKEETKEEKPKETKKEKAK